MPAVEKVQMMNDYLQTCFNMHLGLIDTKSLRSKTIYWAHRLLQEADATAPYELSKFFKDDMKLGTDRMLLRGARTQAGKTLADGGYAQVSVLGHVSLLRRPKNLWVALLVPLKLLLM